MWVWWCTGMQCAMAHGNAKSWHDWARTELELRRFQWEAVFPSNFQFPNSAQVPAWAPLVILQAVIMWLYPTSISLLSPVVRIHEVLSRLAPSRLCSSIAPSRRFARSHSITLKYGPYLPWACFLPLVGTASQDHSKWDGLGAYSFDFLSHPWCQMSHAIASHYFCVCIF